MTPTDTADRTDGYADRYDPDTHFDRWYTDATAAAIAPTIRSGDRVLELGCATGRMTTEFCARGAQVTAVEHSATYLERAAQRDLDVCFEHADIEEWLTRASGEGPCFDHIVATNVVHELRDIDAVFAACRRLVHVDGTFHITLQNPASIHRLTGRALGHIVRLDEVTPEGHDLLTLKIHDAEQLAHALGRAGFVVVARHGIMLKPFPNHEMAHLSDAQLRGLVAVAREFPDHSAMNHLVARPT